MLLHFLFAWLIATGVFVWAGIAIFIFVPLDALDGSLARKIGRQKGGFGAFLDSTSDRIAEIILYSGYLSYFYQTEDVWMSIATYAAVTGSIMVSYTRSRAEALGLSCKVGLLTRVERYVVIVATLILSLLWPGFVNIGIVVLAIGTWFTVGQRVYHVPLLDEQGNLANVLSVRTLIRFLAEFYPQEIYNLPPDSDQIMR